MILIDILKLLKKYGVYLILGILLIILVFYYNDIKKLKSDNIRLQSNVESLELNKDNLELTYTDKEFKKFKADLVEYIQDSMKIKVKTVQQVNTTIINNYDTSTIVFPSTKKNDTIYVTKLIYDCLTVDVEFNTATNSFISKGYNYNDSIIEVYYDSTKHWFNIKWMPTLWMKSVIVKTAKSKCNSSIKTERINLIKN